ncbi:hypothetical protein DENSPDRAFT_622623 [Dentipellis sp. KUC8613]|nr:hypothetical protein DENSPDRAFT_622623 [Dentipellis sp. KUC8613]
MMPPDIDHKILTRILQFVSKKRISLFDLKPPYRLARCALVNKAWLAAAREVLYTHVYLGTCNARDDSVKQFFKTVSKSPHLARLVRSINFGTQYMQRGETSYLAKSIRACSNLTGIRVYGWNGYELDDLTAALKACAKLESLELNRYSLSDVECDEFCDLAGFFDMLKGWPKIRTIVVHKNTVGWDEEAWEEEKEDEIVVTPNSCPDLRHFKFHCGTMTRRYLEALAKIAPSLSRLRFQEGLPLSREKLQYALQTWAPNLTELALNFSERANHTFGRADSDADSKTDYHLDDILMKMPNLRTLLLSSRYCRPATLGGGKFPNLETLIYDMRKGELSKFIGILRQPGCLPALQQLAVSLRTSGDKMDANMSNEVDVVCRQRGVRVRDRFFEELLSFGLDPDAPPDNEKDWQYSEEDEDEDWDDEEESDEGSWETDE